MSIERPTYDDTAKVLAIKMAQRKRDDAGTAAVIVLRTGKLHAALIQKRKITGQDAIII